MQQDWTDLDSWAGLPGGLRWAYGVPLRLGLPWPHAVSKPTQFASPIAGPALLVVAYAMGDGDAPSASLADGSPIPVDAQREALAWDGWPPIFTRRLLVAPIVVPEGETARAINPGSRLVFAVTALRGGADTCAPYLARLAEGARQWR